MNKRSNVSVSQPEIRQIQAIQRARLACQ